MSTKTKTTTKTKPKSEIKKAKKPEYLNAVGRRKTSVARVRLYPGKGDSIVNDMPIARYFPGVTNESIYSSPFKATSTVNQFYVTVKVEGGGITGQAESVAHGIARALVKHDESLRSALKKKGLLKRDPRMKERRKAGYAQAARARKQSPKR